MSSIIDTIRQELVQNSDEKIKKSVQHFFKEEIRLYGIKAATVIKMGKKYFKIIKDKEKDEIFDLCEELWQSGFMEESFIACNWCYSVCKNYEPKDFKIFEKWIKNYVSNWASCDTFCNHTIGTFVDMYPEYLSKVNIPRCKQRGIFITASFEAV